MENYVTYAYEDVTVDGKKAEKVTATMKDGSTSVVIKDLNGNTLSTILGDETVNYTYDNKNRLTAISGRLDGVSEEYTYDALDNLSSYVYNNGSNVASESYAYNTNRQLASKTVDGKTYTYTYKDDTAKSLESVSVGTLGFAPKLDCLGRNKGKTISFITKNEDDSETWAKIAEEQITYLKFGDHATNIPATVYYGDKKNGSYAFSDHFKYKYDSMGNITEIRENGELYAKYTYDTIGRLVREDNKKLGKTTTFTYDTNGNILCRKEYPFTLLETEKLDELDSDPFTYTYDGDKLLSYNGEECTYDAIGNPEKYRGLDADFDNGRQLTSFDGTTFIYDNLGRRTGKNGITFTYDANGNLIRQSNGISFIYDASGVCGICYGNSTYFYRKDILGNIVALLDANGEIVAKYTYDAWGNHTVTDTNGNVITDENHIANLNPFRYRGYYYDVETGLYFLKTRYYDPEIGRFITIDDISYLDSDSINGLNLHAYCLNNPIMMIDNSGCAPARWQWLVSGLTLAVGIALCFVPGGQVFGVGLIVAGATSMTSNILSAAGVDGKTATIVTNVLSIVGGIAFCFTPFAAIGASMIGSGVLGIAGGYVSEAFGGSFELGSAIGNIVGGFLGGQIYKGLVNHGIVPFKTSIKNVVENPLDDINNPNIGPKQGLVTDKIRQIQQTGRYEAIDVIKIPNGSYQVQDGHHTLRALISLGYKYIWVQFTK